MGREVGQESRKSFGLKVRGLNSGPNPVTERLAVWLVAHCLHASLSPSPRRSLGGLPAVGDCDV